MNDEQKQLPSEDSHQDSPAGGWATNSTKEVDRTSGSAQSSPHDETRRRAGDSVPKNDGGTAPQNPFWKGRFPDLIDYVVFFGIFLLATMLGWLVAWIVGKWPDAALLDSPDDAIRRAEEISNGNFYAISYLITMCVTLGGFLFYRRLMHGPRIVARFSAKGLNPVLLLWGVVFMFSVSIVLEPLLSLLPAIPNFTGRGVGAILTVVLMAPVFEELIFRGVLLESTRARYGVVAAWLVSSAIFGLVHFHPAAILYAFVMGLVLAFIYIRTNSLWSTMILHAVNNGISYLALVSGHSNTLLIDAVGNRTLYVVIYIVALAVFVVSGYGVLVALRRLKEAEKNHTTA